MSVKAGMVTSSYTGIIQFITLFLCLQLTLNENTVNSPYMSHNDVRITDFLSVSASSSSSAHPVSIMQLHTFPLVHHIEPVLTLKKISN